MSAAKVSRIDIIAEIGSVHDGSFGNAVKLIELAARLGATTAKFQTHIASAETVRNAPSPSYFSSEDRFSYFERTGFSKEKWRELKAVCESCKLRFLSSPFSEAAVDLLEETGVGAYKIPSGEVTNLPMLRRIAMTGRPVLLSSGMSSWAELDEAVEALTEGRGEVTVMQCTSAYPCPPERVGLNVMTEMRERYHLPVGYSDHTSGIAAPIAAATLGAAAIEKHLTFSRDMYGSDAKNAAEPKLFASMVEAIREVERMLASPVDKSDLSALGDMKSVFEKSIVTARPIRAGQQLDERNLTIKKPGTGIPARRLPDLVGATARIDMPADHLVTEADIEPLSKT